MAKPALRSFPSFAGLYRARGISSSHAALKHSSGSSGSSGLPMRTLRISTVLAYSAVIFFRISAGTGSPGTSMRFRKARLSSRTNPLSRSKAFSPISRCLRRWRSTASKSARITGVSRGKSIVDFGFRRSHMPEAGIAAARAAYITGFSGTSNLEAGRLYGIPVVGTMAHSYIMLFADEETAFRAYSASFPDRGLFLIDTYDARTCTDTIIRLAKEGIPVTGVRIDSGDILEQAATIRKRLDATGLSGIRIFVSNGVDEYSIDRWLAAGVPIDSFGVGTHFITYSDAPFLDMIYKLVEYEGEPRSKSSPGKATFPYRRQIQRHYAGGIMEHDEVVIASGDGGQGLVKVYLRKGKTVEPLPALAGIRATYESGIAQLPDHLKTLAKGEYPVIVHQKRDLETGMP